MANLADSDEEFNEALASFDLLDKYRSECNKAWTFILSHFKSFSFSIFCFGV